MYSPHTDPAPAILGYGARIEEAWENLQSIVKRKKEEQEDHMRQSSLQQQDSGSKAPTLVEDGTSESVRSSGKS